MTDDLAARRWTWRGVLIGILVAGALAWATSKFPPPTRTLKGWGTDHLSHVSSALMFWSHGYRIYVVPPAALLEPAPDSGPLVQKYRWDPDGVLVRAGDSTGLPLFINWPHVARAYPPGSALVHSPIAWLYAGRIIGVDGAARSAIWLYALAAAGASLLFGGMALGALRRGSAPGWRGPAGGTLASMAAAVCASQLFLWAFDGFYDSIFVLCLLLALYWYRRARWTTALLWYAVALAIHFRALWFAPVPIACVWNHYRDTRASGGAFIDRASVLSLLVGGAAMVAFALFYYQVVPGETWAVRNRLYPWSPDFSPTLAAGIALASAATAGILWQYGDRLGAAIVVTVGVLLPGIPQAQAWHSLALVPLVFHCGQRGSGALAGIAAAFYALVALTVFDAHVVDVAKLKLLVTTLLS